MIYDLKTWDFLEEEYPNQYIEQIWSSKLYINDNNYCDTLDLEACFRYENEVWASNDMKEARELYFLINNSNISRSWFDYFMNNLNTNYIK